ncbi:hypothetical protein D3C78_1877300 [compost metagenome]
MYGMYGWMGVRLFKMELAPCWTRRKFVMRHNQASSVCFKHNEGSYEKTTPAHDTAPLDIRYRSWRSADWHLTGIVL